MKLIVAEKPSVGTSLARVVGAGKREDGYFTGNDWYVTWCVGHLAGLAMPEEYGEQYAKWNLDSLPIIPERMKTVPLDGTKKQFNTVVKLMRNPDVDTIVCATDSAREGELIFRRVLELSGVRDKNVMRLWVSSSEDSAYREALRNMKPDSEYDNLYRAGYARAVADWLVGINCTRGYTSLYGDKLPVGRVKTPVLGFIVQREKEIRDFKPVPYYIVKADFGDYFGTMRARSKEISETVVEYCRGRKASVYDVSMSRTKEGTPLLFNTTGAMKTANKLFGYSADETLSLLQSLYDKKLTTYPRVESEYLTSDMKIIAKERAKILGERYLPGSYEFSPVVPDKLINDAKCEEHYALMPTETGCSHEPEGLTDAERRIFYMIVFRLLEACGTERIYLQQKIITKCGDYTFTSSGTRDLDPGFRTIEGFFRDRVKGKDLDDSGPDGEREDEEKQVLPDVRKGDVRDIVNVSLLEKMTKPPKRYTDSSLLTAMENAGKTINETDLKSAISECGLGTPATRAEIIKSLFSDGYAERQKKVIVPTKKGEKLIEVVSPKLVNAVLTAKWEQSLKLISEGKYPYLKYIDEIKDFTGDRIREIKTILLDSGATARRAFSSDTHTMVGVCPRCGRYVFENSKGWCCEDRSCGFAIWKKNRFSENFKKPLNTATVKKLLTLQLIPVKGLTSKAGKKFNCSIQLKDTGKFADIELIFDKEKKRG